MAGPGARTIAPWVGLALASVGLLSVGSYLKKWWAVKSENRRRNEFLQAACDGNIGKIVQALELGQDLTCADKHGSNALMLASWAGRREVVLLLLHNGADVHATSFHGWTALTYAARAGEAATCQVLVEWGADVNIVENTTGATPLMFAAFVGSLECVELLLDYGADPLIRTKQGALAFAFAEENGHDGIAGMLRHRAADAQAESQAIKEQKEAVAARQKAKQAIELRKKQEQAYIQRLEEQRKRAAIERENYLSSFSGQVEILSVGCYVPLDKPTVREIIRVLMQSKWEPGPKSKSRRGRATSLATLFSEFEVLHQDLLRRRALNALSRPMKKTDDLQESDSEEDSELDSDEDGSDSDLENEKEEVQGANITIHREHALSSDSGSPPRTPVIKSILSSDRSIASTRSEATSTEGTPVKLYDIILLVQPILDRYVDGVVPMPENRKLRAAANSVNFGAREDQESLLEIFGGEDADKNLVHSFQVLSGIGAMASSYLNSMRVGPGEIPNARTRMPYYLQVEPHVFAPLAKLMTTLTTLAAAQDFPETYTATCKASLFHVLTIVQAHLMSITLLRIETTRSRDALAILGDALLYVTFLLGDEPYVLPDATQQVSQQHSNASPRGRGGSTVSPLIRQGSELTSKLRSNTEFALHVPGGMGMDISTTPRATTTNELRDAGRVGLGPSTTELTCNDDVEDNSDPANFASKILADHLRVLSKSPQAELKFLAKIWRRTRSKTKAQLRRQVAEALVAERAISYLVCPASDSPRPLGESPSSKRRLARVLGISDFLNSSNSSIHRSRKPATGEFRTAQNSPKTHLLSRNLSAMPSLSRNRSFIEEVEDPLTPSGSSRLSRARFSSLSRRDSIQNRVRVRSVLGESSNSGRTTSTMLQKRTQALITIQRAARSFIQSGAKGESSGRGDGSVIDDEDFNGDEDLNAIRFNSKQDSSRERRVIYLEEVESVLSSDNCSLVQGRVPAKVADWLQDERQITSSICFSTEAHRGMFQATTAQASNLMSDASPPLEPEVEKIASLVPIDLSFSLADSSVVVEEESIDLISLLEHSVIENDDIPSAVVLRCIQDDLISRLMIIFQRKRLAPSSLGSTPGSPQQKRVESFLLQHCQTFLSKCCERPFRNADQMNKYPRKRRGEDATSRCLAEEIACELMERMNLLWEWTYGADLLTPTLLDLVQNANTPLYMKICATKLMCSFAKGKIKAFDSSSAVNEAIEHLLYGPLFALPAQVELNDEETTEVFLQDLARSPAQPVHSSKALALHAFVSSRPQLRFLTSQIRGKPSILEDVVRISVSALLKHTHTASLAYRIANEHDFATFMMSATQGKPLQTPELDPVEVTALVSIWKAAWEIASKLVSVYRTSQRAVCAENGCSLPVVEDNGSWRCEHGHVSDIHDVKEGQSYQEICAEVAARARILLNIAVAVQSEISDDSNLFRDVLQHAKRFVGSASSDHIKAEKLELYLKAKSRYSLLREQGLKMLRDCLHSFFRLRTMHIEENPGSNSVRIATIKAAASRASSFAHTTKYRKHGSIESDAVVPVVSEIQLEPILESIREAFTSMHKFKQDPGPNALDFQLPSNSASAIQSLSHDIVDLLVRVVEESPNGSDECMSALSVLQIISIKFADHGKLVKLKLASRLLHLVTVSTNSGDPAFHGAVWSIFSRFALQAMNSSWVETREEISLGTGVAVGTVLPENDGSDDEDNFGQESSFREGFTDLQRSIAYGLHNELGGHVLGLLDPSDPIYDVAELQCFRYLSLLGALCTRPRITYHFSTLFAEMVQARGDSLSSFSNSGKDEPLDNMEASVREGSQHSHLILRLITSPSPRIQQLALRIGRRVLANGKAEDLVPILFKVAGEWALHSKGITVGDKAGDLSLECAGMIRYLAGRFSASWGTAVRKEFSIAAHEYLADIYEPDPDILYRFWTTLAVLNMSAPSTLRPGCRIKVVPETGMYGWNESRSTEEYGLVIRMSKRQVAGSRNDISSLNGPNFMVILDSDPTKLPTKCDPEKVLPVTIMLETYKDFFISLRGSVWLSDVLANFAENFWNVVLQKDMAWCELRTMAMSILHGWLSTDTSHAINQITAARPRIWRHIVSICASPAPICALENVDDISTTAQAVSDIKLLLCEFGMSAIDSATHRVRSSSRKSASQIEHTTGSKTEEPIPGIDEETPVSLSGKNVQVNLSSEASAFTNVRDVHSTDLRDRLRSLTVQSVLDDSDEDDEEEENGSGEKISLLSAPLLQPSRRAALARQASHQIFSPSGTPPSREENFSPAESQSTSEQMVARRFSDQGSNHNVRSVDFRSQETNGAEQSSTTESVDPVSTHSLRRNSSSSVTRLERRPRSGSLGPPTPRNRVAERPEKRRVKFESSSMKPELNLITPFREMDRGDQISYLLELQIERNRRRARLERKRRAARRMRTLSSSSSSLNEFGRTGRSGLLRQNSNGVPLPSLCQPDTPRGRDAAPLTLPVELPTVDTMLSVPLSSSGPPPTPGKGSSLDGTHGEARRHVVQPGTLLRISQEEVGIVKQVQEALNGNEVALVDIFNSSSGSQTTSWRDIADLELSEDAIADRYRLFTWDGGPSSKGREFNSPVDSKAKEKLGKELRRLYTRSSILHARRAAVAAISGSVGVDGTAAQMQPLVGEAGGASQILGMLKLCEATSSSESAHQSVSTEEKIRSASSMSTSRGLWRAVALLFERNDDFAEILLDEAVIYLSMTAKDTLCFETPHPLCPIEEFGQAQDEDTDEDGMSIPGSMEAGSQRSFTPSPVTTMSGEGSVGGETPSSTRPQQSTSPLSARALSLDTISQTSQYIEEDSNGTQQLPPSPSLSEARTKLSENPSVEPRRRKLTGSHRFCIKGASGLLVEFDRRSSIISAATQVTLSYDPQDREVIKVLGEGGADAWQPVVVSGDTCYMHWNVNQGEILSAMQRMEELNVDIEEVAWGVAVRVRSLDEASNSDEMQVLERPFGWRLMRVLADFPDRVLMCHKAGKHFFETAIGYLRTNHLAFKPELCEVITLLVKSLMEVKKKNSPERLVLFDGEDPEKDNNAIVQSWEGVMRHGLYKLHHDLLLMFDEVVEDGFTSVSPYFVCLLELLVLCRDLWALHPTEYLSRFRALKGVEVSRSSLKAPLCSMVIYGRRENAKVVMDCETCNLVGAEAICVACAASCHTGHILKNERTTTIPCGCSQRGPDSCCALRPFADVWKVGLSDRTWFDVVCQTADVIDCISTGSRPIPRAFIREAYRTCEDGKLLRLCLRSLEECLRSEVQGAWWDRESRHMWANMLDQGMDSVAEVAFGMKVLVSSLLPSAFLIWWEDRKQEWLQRVHTNQGWVLAQAMLQLSFALAPSACYAEWDARLPNWTITLEGIAGLGGEGCCTFPLTGEFPRPQVYMKCNTCKKELCEYCSSQHASKGHNLSDETFAPGYCDERTPTAKELQRPRFERFSEVAVANFDMMHDLYWMNHENGDIGEDQVPAEPRTLASLLNIPYRAFEMIEDLQEEAEAEESPKIYQQQTKSLIACSTPSNSNILSACFLGILIEILGVKDDSDFLCVSCDSDHGLSLATGALLSNGCRSFGSGTVHGVVATKNAAKRVMYNLDVLRNDFGVPLGPIHVQFGDLLAHARAVSDFSKKYKKYAKNPDDPPPPKRAIPGLLNKYDRIFCSGLCTLEQLDALSALLPLDGALLCPLVDSLNYGIYVQRNQFTGEWENRTLVPIYEDSETFVQELRNLKYVLSKTEPPSLPKFEKISVGLPANSETPVTDSFAEKKAWETAVEPGGPQQEQGHDEHVYESVRVEATEEDPAYAIIRKHHDALRLKNRERENVFDKVGEVCNLEFWKSLADFATHRPGRETSALGFRDISPRSIEAYPLLQQIEHLEVVKGRFAVLKRINDSLSEVLPLINLTPQYSTEGIGKQLSRSEVKCLIFLSTKLEAWSKALEPNWSDAPPHSMPSITVSRKLADIGLVEDSLFMQTYNQIQNFPLCSLRRRDQSFKVRFAGEGGHDVGGLYRDLFSEMCSELRESRPPLLFHPPLMSKGRGEPLHPRPSLSSPGNLRLFEFLGNLMGMACMRHGITLSIDISPLVWKFLVKDALSTSDLVFIDEVALQEISFIRKAKPEEFDSVFPDSVFAVAPIDASYKEPSATEGNEPGSDETSVEGQESSQQNIANPNTHGWRTGNSTEGRPDRMGNLVELCPLGKERRVTFDNAVEYAQLLQTFRLNESQSQFSAMKRGISPLVPARLLPMFTWQELENLVCGVADVDVEFLHSRTKYVGGVKITDSHIRFFWDVLANEFTPEDRTQFLRFVWGRERLSTADEGNTFVIGPHLRARDSGDPDKWLPVAHTCFFSIDLPAFSSKEILKERLLFAIRNCSVIDADQTAESSTNMALSLN